MKWKKVICSNCTEGALCRMLLSVSLQGRLLTFVGCFFFFLT